MIIYNYNKKIDYNLSNLLFEDPINYFIINSFHQLIVELTNYFLCVTERFMELAIYEIRIENEYVIIS